MKVLCSIRKKIKKQSQKIAIKNIEFNIKTFFTTDNEFFCSNFLVIVFTNIADF